ncbi:hypothetical protein [Brachybacterium paraconglomeratum]|uniref:hypothetical protein n=1 Tax=Brachybacterium paraconglomeratum TaxID=173362 RepID=UPI00026C7043|nr:hypothetical protein [Brachybacterium paraconglomeratum]
MHRKGLAEVERDPDRRRALLRSGKIRSVDQWYVTEEAPEDLLALLELGVRPTCLDAAALHGLWIPMAVGVHAYRPRRVEAPPDAPRLRVRSQAQLLPDVRVDLLIGTNWVIECDSRRFHDDPTQYREDRRRGLTLSSRGYRVTRLTWEQVFLDWSRTSAMLLEMLRRRDHRRLLPVRAAG